MFPISWKSGRLTLCTLLLAVQVGVANVCYGGQISVDPVSLEMVSPTAAGTLSLKNNGDTEVSVQTRVFRWTQVNGDERLDPTTDVVASPPAVKLAPGSDYVVRIVRVSKRPIEGEECYRVLIDQLPDLKHQSARTINLLVRQSIPVFFQSQQVTAPRVVWAVHSDGDKLIVEAANNGEQRLRVASLRVRDQRGETISFGDGLAGYVLGRTSIKWVAPIRRRDFGAGGAVSITAATDKGPLNAAATLSVRR